MKSYVVLGLSVLGVALFVFPVHATTFQTNMDALQVGCVKDNNINGTCTTNGHGLIEPWSVWQQLYLGRSAIDIYSIDVATYGDGQQGGGGSANAYLLLLNENEWNRFVTGGYSNNDLWGHATSSTPGGTALAFTTTTFPFSFPVTYSPTPGDTNHFVAFAVKSTTQVNYYKPSFRIAQQSYPLSPVANPWAYSGGANNGSAAAYFTNSGDLQFAIDQDTATIQITNPAFGSTQFRHFTANGTCSNISTVDLNFIPQTATTTYTDYVAIGIPCNSGTWQLPGLTLSPQGPWRLNVTNSGTVANAVSSFTYSDIEPPEHIVFDFRNPFATTSPTSTWGWLYDNSNVVLNHMRPYIYVPQIIDALITAMNNATSSNWVASTTFATPLGNRSLPGISSATFDDVPVSFKTTIRPLSTVAMILGFVWSLWALRHRFV